MEGVESKAESQGQGSQTMSENVEGFQQRVNEIFKLLEQDENFSEIIPEIYDCKKSKLKELVNELSWALADRHVHSIEEVGKNTHNLETPIKTEQVDSCSSTFDQKSNTNELKTTGDYESTLNDSGGGFQISNREGSESSELQTKVHDPEVLLKWISTLEEVFGLNTKIQNLSDENAILEAEKGKAEELKLVISESNRKIETTVHVLEGSRQQVIRGENEILKLKQEPLKKVQHQTELLDLLSEELDVQTAIDESKELIAKINVKCKIFTKNKSFHNLSIA